MTPAQTIFAASRFFSLNPEESKPLEKYYILHWTRSYFLSQTVRKDRIIHQDVEYLVLHSPAESPYLIDTPHVKLSFRKIEEFDYGYVLVRPIGLPALQ